MKASPPNEARRYRRTEGRGGWAIFVAVAMAVPFLLVGIGGEAEAASTERYLAIREGEANPDHAWASFDGNPTKVYDFDGDGQLEIIAQNDNHWAYIFDSRDGDVLAEKKATVPSWWGARTFNGPEAAVLTPGGDPHLVLGSSAAYVSVFRFDASQSHSDYFHFEKQWEKRLNTCHDDPGMDAKVVFADLDQDGDLEIIAATEEQGVYALHHDGSMMWHNCVGGGNAAPGIGDLNQDGYPDVVHVNDGGVVAALNGRTGNWLWGYDVSESFNVGSGAITVQPAVAQLDGSGGPDIVLGARDSHDPDNWDDNHALLLALSSDGRVLWHHQHPQANPLTYTRPIVVDADNDGSPEVYWGDWNTNGHKPPYEWQDQDPWQRLGPANFYRYSQWGNLEWRTTLDTWWSNKDLAIGDVDGDGTQEILANGPNSDGSRDGIWYLDVNTGAKEGFTTVYPWKVMRAPILADLWGSGTMQWVVQVDPATSGYEEAILIYDTHASYDAAWPHVAYPREPSGGGGGGDFSASFSGVKGNEWWIQTQVSTSGGSLSHVDVSLNGGSWKPLEDKGWGWAASYHAPEGTIVQLRATSTGGATDHSACYRWTDATRTDCGSGGGGGDFDARFYGVKGNEWWIQTQVDTEGGQLSAVDVRLDGGNWKPLQDEGWGWAESYHAPEGTVVQFRATSTTGETDLSACVEWTDANRVDCGASSFTADFYNVRGNEWWVETDVDVEGGTLAGVDARVNGGSWQSLEKQDWGSWAKSIHAPSGSTVEFRAISSSGDTAHSGSYTW